MRPDRILVLLLVLAGCGPTAATTEVAVGVVTGASIPIFHRTPVDMAVSAGTGRNCSLVNLDKGQSYCQPKEPPPDPPPFCTRSLGVPNCWAEPSKLPNNPREIADGPRTLTKEQEADRTKWWPALW